MVVLYHLPTNITIHDVRYTIQSPDLELYFRLVYEYLVAMVVL